MFVDNLHAQTVHRALKLTRLELAKLVVKSSGIVGRNSGTYADNERSTRNQAWFGRRGATSVKEVLGEICNLCRTGTTFENKWFA